MNDNIELVTAITQSILKEFSKHRYSSRIVAGVMITLWTEFAINTQTNEDLLNEMFKSVKTLIKEYEKIKKTQKN